MSPTTTRLAQALAEPEAEARATPVTVFRMARKRWLAEQRINLADLAKDAGIGRATLFRWIGSKDLLIQEILWSLYQPVFERAVREAGASGAEHVIAVHRRVIVDVLFAEPIQRFFRHDREYALRLLTASNTVLHQRTVAIAREHLEALVARGEIELPISAQRFAEIVTRINKSLMYGDFNDDYADSIEDACTVLRLLLARG